MRIPRMTRPRRQRHRVQRAAQRGAGRVAHIPIHNDTGYPLTEAMTQYILRDAKEYCGEEVYAIRVQAGLERHAFNARTHEVRYAFSPQDFGLVRPMSVTPDPLTPPLPRTRQRPSRSAAEVEADLVPASLEDVEAEEDMEPLDTSPESLEEGRDDEEDVFTLDAQTEDEDEEEDQDDQDDDERDFDAEEYEV